MGLDDHDGIIDARYELLLAYKSACVSFDGSLIPGGCNIHSQEGLASRPVLLRSRSHPLPTVCTATVPMMYILTFHTFRIALKLLHCLKKLFAQPSSN